MGKMPVSSTTLSNYYNQRKTSNRKSKQRSSEALSTEHFSSTGNKRSNQGLHSLSKQVGRNFFTMDKVHSPSSADSVKQPRKGMTASLASSTNTLKNN